MNFTSPLILISLFTFCINVYPLSADKVHFDQATTDQRLRAVAIEQGVIPEHIDEAYIEEATGNGNTFLIWIATDRQQRVKIVDTLKEIFRKEGTIVKNPSAYYADQMNNIIAWHIIEGTYDYSQGPGLKTLLGSIAAMEGDLGNNTSKVESLRLYLGDEMFEHYKANYPEKYEYLVEGDKL